MSDCLNKCKLNEPMCKMSTKSKIQSLSSRLQSLGQEHGINLSSPAVFCILFISTFCFASIFQESAYLYTYLPAENRYLTSLESVNDLGDSEDPSSCAVLFFGCPRSFKLFVLPSIIENVFLPNLENNCDYYIHYFAIESEGENRKGEAGGEIHGEDVFLLQNALKETYERFGKDEGNVKKLPQVYITNSTAEEFQDARQHQMDKYETTLDENGNYVYYPYSAKSWEFPNTMRNMIKQWHSINEVWDFMEHTRRKEGIKKYSRVAMLRNDVMYITPFDIFKLPNHERDVENSHLVIPDWSNYPVNDRMVAGPYNAVKIWATERFARIDKHAREYPTPGFGAHSERFMEYTILPAMKESGNYTLSPDPNFLFFRSRANGCVWIQDCAESTKEDFEPQVMTLLKKYHSYNVSDGGIRCERQSIKGIKKQDVISCSGDPDMAVWNRKGRGVENKEYTQQFSLETAAKS